MAGAGAVSVEAAEVALAGSAEGIRVEAVQVEAGKSRMPSDGVDTMNTEKDLDDLVARLKSEAGKNLICVILYGSAATGEFHEGHSDLNILCILWDLHREELDKLSAVSLWWAKKGHPVPMFLTRNELYNATDIYAIEFVDIANAHKVLYGEDLMATLEIPLDRHFLQVERELRNNTLRLRQQYLQYPHDERKTLDLMTSSISSFAALFRHALIAFGEQAPSTKKEAIDRLAAELQFDPVPFHTIMAIREKRKQESDISARSTFDGYLRAIAKVTDEVDQRLASRRH
jgi:hypothetical protein